MKAPRCPDCSSSQVRQIVYGEPGPDLWEQAEKGLVTLGGCLLEAESPSWNCADCGNRFGTQRKRSANQQPRSQAEWMDLVETMVPAPSHRKTSGIITGGDPVTVLVRVADDGIHVLEPELVWASTSVPVERAAPFARVPLRAAATRVAELILMASSKRLSRYRWCPRCRRVREPERMLKSVCHGCAEKVLGVVF